MVRRLKRLSKPAMAMRIGVIRPGGASASPSIQTLADLLTQKGSDNSEQGRIFRAGWKSQTARALPNRSDIEVFFDQLPEPIDLELDLKHRVLYWTDRGDPPRGIR